MKSVILNQSYFAAENANYFFFLNKRQIYALKAIILFMGEIIEKKYLPKARSRIFSPKARLNTGFK